ncbi:MAG: porin [Pseudomonadota bacterium]|nr:porin [Pseudomonadota bacterium]
MNKSALSLAVLAAFAIGAPAQAQTNVQVYGLIDAGVESLNHANANQNTVTKVISGGKNTSRWGFRGTEELGGGLKAVFGLEGGILLDTGNADGPLFKRQAFVGLDGSFGRIVIGRSFTTTYDFVILFDPLGYAPNYSWATSSNATGPSKYGMNTAFDNLIKYSGSTGEFKYGATVGLGEQAGSSADSRKYSVGASWTHAGLGLMGTYEQINGNTLPVTFNRDETTAYHLAADYKTGDWRLTGGMRGYKLVAGKAATADVRADTYWGGVSYLVQPAVTLTGAVYHVDVKNVAAGQDADPTMYVARVLYALSKRTDLYAATAYAKAKNGKLVGLSRDDAGFGTTQTGVTVGIQHRF